MTKSLLDYAFDCISQSKEPVNFKDLWAYVVKESGMDEELAARKISSFYTNLMLDGRFVTFGENNWDLRTRHSFDKVHIDMKDVYATVDEEEASGEDEDEDEKEYNKAFEEPKDEEEDSEEETEESENEEEQREER